MIVAKRNNNTVNSFKGRLMYILVLLGNGKSLIRIGIWFFKEGVSKLDGKY